MRFGAPQLWQPLGRIVGPEPTGDWWASHASYPTALILLDGTVRIYFSVRDRNSRSSLASIDVALDGQRWRPLGPARGPLFGPGPRGAFDADGVTVSCVIAHQGKLLAYYLGWTVGGAVPFTNFIGLALSDGDGARFERWSPAPVVGRSRENPFTVGYPWVTHDAEGFRMWFGSHLQWGPSGLEMQHVVKQARSADGRTWVADAEPVIPLAAENDRLEFAVSRPVVIVEQDTSRSMWYARRRPGYALGFAHSRDGKSWLRRDGDVGFLGTAEDWESTERTYPCVFDHGGERYMLYNGDSYGRTGFGVAILRKA